MSRIREALKKAAEERSVQATAGGVEGLIDVLGEKSPEGPSPVSQSLPGTSGLQERVKPPQTVFDTFVAKCRHAHWHFEPRYSVFADETNHKDGAERFRTLRSRLYQIAAGQPLRRILLTSSVPQEGKTFVASNLAQSMIRQEGRRVLLVDADLRASCLHRTLGTDCEPGLSDYLCGNMDITKVIQAGEEGKLCFVPGGRQILNPSELLHSEKMKSLLERMTQLFDWVILDSPPAIAVHDASLLADMCDGVLFVVRAGSTDFEVAQKAAAEFHDKKLLGVVLNRVDKAEAYGHYYYGYSSAKDDD